MAKNTEIVSTINANATEPVKIVTATGTGKTTLITGAANGTVVRGISVVNSSSSINMLRLYLSINGNDYNLVSRSIDSLAGYDGVKLPESLFDLLPALKFDNAGNKVLMLESGMSLKVSVDTTVAIDKSITVTAFAEDF